MADDGVYEYPFEVGPADLDGNGHMNNAVYFRYLQEAAEAHWYSIFPAERDAPIGAWVVRRHEIDYLRPATLGDRLVARTWLGEPTAVTWERFTRVVRPADGQLVADARTVYVLLDPRTGRPRRIATDWAARVARPARGQS